MQSLYNIMRLWFCYIMSQLLHYELLLHLIITLWAVITLLAIITLLVATIVKKKKINCLTKWTFKWV